MAFLSVIIPIYKVELYLRQCIESVLNQRIDDLEIVLVDDGSPDNCPIICDEYARIHKNIVVVHKKNGGLSSARNAGLSVATGEYIMFLDSDDWWNEEVDMQAIIRDIRHSEPKDMYLLTSLDYVEGVGLYKRKEHDNLDSIRTDSVEHYYQDLLSNGNLEVHAATKILNKGFIVRNGLIFKEGILSEDNEWILRVLRCLNSVSIINQPIYIYRAGRPGSITNNIRLKNIKDLLLIIKESIEFYDKNPDGKNKNNELCYVSYLWFSALGLSTLLPNSEQKKVEEDFIKTSAVCQYSTSKKTKACYIVYSLVGYRMTSCVLGIYIRLKRKHGLNKRKV